MCGSLPKISLHQRLNARNARRATDQHDFVDVRRLELGVVQRLHHRLATALDQAVDQFLELGPTDGHLQVLRTVLVGRDERQVDVGLRGRTQFLLGLFAGFLQTLQRHRVLAQVDPLLFLELVGHVVDQDFVEVVTTQVRIATGADHFEDGHVTVLAFGRSDFQDRDVERTATQVEDGDLLVGLLAQSVGQRGRRRLVDDPSHFQPGDLAGILGGLPLRVVEVRRHGDHGLVDLVSQVRLGRFLELAQHHRRDFLRRVLLVARLDLHVVVLAARDLVGHHLLFRLDFAVPSAHEALDRVDRLRGIGDGLPPRRFADQRFALVRESPRRWASGSQHLGRRRTTQVCV